MTIPMMLVKTMVTTVVITMTAATTTKLLQGNVIWGLGNGYHSSHSSQSERVTQSPKSLISCPPFYSKADEAFQTTPANQDAPHSHPGFWLAIDPSTPKPAKPN